MEIHSRDNGGLAAAMRSRTSTGPKQIKLRRPETAKKSRWLAGGCVSLSCRVCHFIYHGLRNPELPKQFYAGPGGIMDASNCHIAPIPEAHRPVGQLTPSSIGGEEKPPTSRASPGVSRCIACAPGIGPRCWWRLFRFAMSRRPRSLGIDDQPANGSGIWGTAGVGVGSAFLD